MLTLELQRRADYTLLCAGGELDIETSVTFRQRLTELVSQGGLPLVVDLSGLRFVDSCGLGALVVTLRLPEEVRPRLVLESADGHIARLLRTTRMDRLLPIYPTLEAALAASAVRSAA